MISPRLLATTVLFWFAATAFAYPPQSVQGMINGFLYTFTDEGLTFRSFDADKEELHIRWTSEEMNCQVYMLDPQGTPQVFDIKNDAEMVWHDREILIENIYPNIDLVIHPGNMEADQMTFEFVVYPGGNPKDIMIESKGLNASHENLKKDAVIPVSILAQQNLGSEMIDTPISMNIEPEEKVQFSVPSYDQANTLSIQIALQVQSHM
ncbi:MAG: hypothetical protein AAFR59_08045, partial [Bacteroidota bacterium]